MSRATSAYWMMWPAEPLSEGSPKETLSPSSESSARRAATPIVVAISTPSTKASEFFIARSDVTKTIADMICGPAIIVIASGSMSVFTPATLPEFAPASNQIRLGASSLPQRAAPFACLRNSAMSLRECSFRDRSRPLTPRASLLGDKWSTLRAARYRVPGWRSARGPAARKPPLPAAGRVEPSDLQRAVNGDHRRAAGVDGVDDLGVVDALQVNGGDAEVGVPELALDDDQRHALAGHLDGRPRRARAPRRCAGRRATARRSGRVVGGRGRRRRRGA